MQSPAHLEEAFQQRPYVAKAAEDMQYGMCVGFSAEWLWRHRGNKGEAIKARVDYLKSDGAVGGAEVLQRTYRAARTPRDSVLATGQVGALGKMLGGGNPKITIEKRDAVDYDKDDEENFLKDMFEKTCAIQRYYLMMLSFGESRLKLTEDNHVIAGYHSGGKFRGWGSHLYVFEPNFGEFKLAGNEVKAFFREIAAAYLDYENMAGAKSPKKLRMINVYALSFP